MNQQIDNLVSEYRMYVIEATKGQEIDWHTLVDVLCSEGEWTHSGAEQLAAIVQDYGSFILKNAHALALAAGIEDGLLGL